VEIVKNYDLDRMERDDWPYVKSIYMEGITTGIATFETDAPDWREWNNKHLKNCRLVARSGDVVMGWAALSPVSNRCVYEGVAEVSVYIALKNWGKGIGNVLLSGLVTESEKALIWTLQSSIFPENKASIAIHKACGFREVGIREKLGQINDEWKNVMLMERRSVIVGK